MSEQLGEIKSLGKLENWGGGFPVPHEFSTLDDVRRWNKNSSNGIYDEALSATDKVLDKWLDLSVKAPMGLYLYGGPGNGKTHVAVGLGRVLAKNGVKVAYFHAPRHNPDDFKSMATFMSIPSSNGAAQNRPQSMWWNTEHHGFSRG